MDFVMESRTLSRSARRSKAAWGSLGTKVGIDASPFIHTYG